MIKYKLFTTIFLGVFFTFTGFINVHTGTHAESHVKTWHLSEDNYKFKADYIKLKEGIVFPF